MSESSVSKIRRRQRKARPAAANRESLPNDAAWQFVRRRFDEDRPESESMRQWVSDIKDRLAAQGVAAFVDADKVAAGLDRCVKSNWGICNVREVPLLGAPDTKGEQIGSLYFADCYRILEFRGAWAWVRNDTRRQSGWIPLQSHHGINEGEFKVLIDADRSVAISFLVNLLREEKGESGVAALALQKSSSRA